MSIKCLLFIIGIGFIKAMAADVPSDACINSAEYLRQAIRREPSESLRSKSSASNRFFKKHALGSIKFLHPVEDCNRFVAMEHYPEEARVFRSAMNLSEQFEKSIHMDSPATSMKINSKGFSSFYQTADKEFFMKSMHFFEIKLWTKKGLALGYYTHFQTTPSSLLAKFMGVYTVYDRKFKWFTHFIIMKNIMKDCLSDVDYEEFDLKGSTWNRFREPPQKPGLDENFADREIPVPSNTLSYKLNDQVEKDARFLESFSIMDYSLLLGIQSHPQTSVHNNTLSSYRVDGNSQICLGIIDFLTEYKFLIKAVHYVRRIIYGPKSNKQSNKRPWKYRKRFIKTLREKIQVLET